MKAIEKIFVNYENGIYNECMSTDECKSILHDRDIYIYGCGNAGTTLTKRLQNAGYVIQGFIDNGQGKSKGTYEGIQIYRTEELYKVIEKEKPMVIIVALFSMHIYPQIKSSLENVFGLQAEIYYFTEFRKLETIFNTDLEPAFSAFMGENPEQLVLEKEKIISVYDVLEDDESKSLYCELLEFYLGKKFVDFTLLPFEEHYFAYDIYSINEEEVFVDCGAYDGDTLEIFIKNQDNKFKKYIAIEADEINCTKIQQKIDDNRVSVLNHFIADDNYVINFESTGTSYGMGGANGSSVMTKTLDELTYSDAPTFIKVNLEGYDLDAIRGASTIIKEYKPIVSVQGHHKSNHFWEIIETLKAMADDYKFYLRNYGGIIEYTFYAIPLDRLV